MRDYGRFGLFFLNGGVVGEKSILPEGWIAEAGSPKMISRKKVNYGYMWWIPDSSVNPVHEGVFLARGIFGQLMYSTPQRRLLWSFGVRARNQREVIRSRTRAPIQCFGRRLESIRGGSNRV